METPSDAELNSEQNSVKQFYSVGQEITFAEDFFFALRLQEKSDFLG
jgi:hypothetical protein